MQVAMIDVPMAVWDDVHDKWTKALKEGWSDKLWSRCALCNHMKDVYGIGSCHICPLNGSGWCRVVSAVSRINIAYHLNDIASWRNDIKLFLEYIKPYCSEAYK